MYVCTSTMLAGTSSGWLWQTDRSMTTKNNARASLFSDGWSERENSTCNEFILRKIFGRRQHLFTVGKNKFVAIYVPMSQNKNEQFGAKLHSLSKPKINQAVFQKQCCKHSVRRLFTATSMLPSESIIAFSPCNLVGLKSNTY